jgi:tripartite ATP-independent transporter DctP family solute receptor
MKTKLLVATVVLLVGWVAPSQAQTTLKFGHYAETSHPAHDAAVQFSANVEKRTNGQIKVQVFPANQLGNPAELLQQTKLGVIDFAIPTQGQLDKFEKAFAAVMLPFAFANLAEAHKMLDGPVMDWLAPLGEKQGFKLLANWEWGFRHITNSKLAINAPGDVKGLKVRVPPEVQLEATMEALGAQVTKIAFPELYLALSQGVVDGQENPVAVIYSLKMWEVQKHIAITGHSYNNAILVMNNARFAALSSDHKKIVQEEAIAAGSLMRRLAAEKETSQLAELQSKGMQLTRPNVVAFRELMEPATRKISAYAGEENVKRFTEILAKARGN